MPRKKTTSKKRSTTTRRKTTAKKRTTTKKKSSSRSKSQEMLVVASKAKAYIKKHKCNTAGDALEGLNTMLYWYLEQACKRAKDNNRKTVRNHDFISM